MHNFFSRHIATMLLRGIIDNRTNQVRFYSNAFVIPMFTTITVVELRLTCTDIMLAGRKELSGA